jgi:hypothetical protein
VTVVNTITHTGAAPARIDWATLLPAGWKYVGGGNEAAVRPVSRTAELLEWSWASVPPSPIEFTFTVLVPAGATADEVIASLVSSVQSGSSLQAMARPAPPVVRNVSFTTRTAIGTAGSTCSNSRASLNSIITAAAQRGPDTTNSRRGPRTGSHRGPEGPSPMNLMRTRPRRSGDALAASWAGVTRAVLLVTLAL